MADWLGRRWLIILSLTGFGALTLATAYAQSLEGLLALRFLTGIGLGACMSNVVALTSEYVPSRMRATMTTWMFCGYPLGASLGGLVVANLSATYGWRSVFVGGGVLPLLLAAIAVLSLPESLIHLASRPRSEARIAAVVRRFGPKAALPTGATLTNSEHRPGLTVGHLFRDGRTLGTVLLWVMFFLMLVEVFLLTSWTPTLLNQAGKSMTVSVLTMAIVQGGGVITLLIFGPLFDRLGFQVTLVPLLIAAALAIALMGNTSDSVGLIMAFAFVAGAGVMGGQSSLIVLAAVFYPSFIRSTGVGWALGVGRIGSIVGPVVGGVLLSLQWEMHQVFLIAAIPVFIAGIAAFSISRMAIAKA